jgi:Asp/Glu/hydantoin racemase
LGTVEGEHAMALTALVRPRGTIADLGVGVLMLDTRFRRLPGDIGNGQTWSFPVQFKVVKGASPQRVVQEADPTLLQPFINAAMELIELGVGAISTSCGFLALFQKELQAAIPVPVASSSLLQVPLAKAMLPVGKRIGILTFQADKLTARHLAAVGVDTDTPVEGLFPGSHFHAVYGDHGAEPDPERLEHELIEAAKRLLERHPEVGALVLECTNMPLHSAALHRVTGLPVYDIVGLIEWLGRSLRPPNYPAF